jgi:N-methylhydantoinase A/oxoprolinase/acetone carboxylase beta subunit
VKGNINSINIDIGGTFTDCFTLFDGRVATAKTPTTGYNLSVGFVRTIRETASSLGISVEELLQNVELVTYSTTIAMNTLIQRTGPKLGLLLTEGFEDIVPVGKGSSWADARTVREIRNVASIEKPEPLILREMTRGVKERIDSNGKIIRPLDEEDMLDKIQYMVDNGAMGFVVCLLWSFLNPTHERRIREIIRREYPESYLGAMPVVLSSEVLPKQFEYTRAVTTILNAYLHQSMWEQLSGVGDELRDYGYHRPLMMVHNSGGMAEVFHTAAIQTYNGGPVAGLIGGAHLGKTLGYSNVVVSDMGGTSFDLGTIVAGSTRFYEYRPIIDRWWVDISMVETRSIGAGGGSIAWLNPAVGNRLEVGPRSAGSMPGPAAYNLGGVEPTVTDADIVLGYINPDYYHGGRMRLNKGKALTAVTEKIARPLNIGVEEAALLIKKIVDASMGDIIHKETALRGYDPSDFILFSYGGAGPTHCCGYGFRAGMNKIVTFPFSPVFCAFGSAVMGVTHIYEQTRRIPLIAPQTMKYFEDYDDFNRVVERLQAKAIKSIEDEGFRADEIVFSLELDMKYGGQLNIHRATSPRLRLETEEDARAIYLKFEREYTELYSSYSVFPQGGVEIYDFILRATVPRPKPELPTYPEKGKSPPQEALKGQRPAYWEEYKSFCDTNTYAQELLETGNTIEGPAIIEAQNTTTVLPPGIKLTIDFYHNMIIEKK